MGKTIVLISSKGGSGKSTAAVGLTSAFALAGRSVLLIDADEGARCLDTMLGAGKETVFDLADVLGGADCDTVKLRVPGLDSVSLIPSPSDSSPLDLARLFAFVKSESHNYDYVIVDMKGQLPAGRLEQLPFGFDYISVVTTDEIAVKNTGVMSAALARRGIRTRLIINRFRKKDAGGKTVNIDGIIDRCGAGLLGIVPEDRKIGIMGQSPIVFGKAAQAIYRIASRIEGTDVPLPAIKKI